MTNRHGYLSIAAQEALVRDLRAVADRLIVSSRALPVLDALRAAGLPDRSFPTKVLRLELPHYEGLPYLVGFGKDTTDYKLYKLAEDVQETLYALWNVEVVRSGAVPGFVDVWLVDRNAT